MVCSLLALLPLRGAEADAEPPADLGFYALGHSQGEMAGEVTVTSVILQSRLTKPEPHAAGDIFGLPGVACFELSTHAFFERASVRTPSLEAKPEADYIVKSKVTGLLPGTLYYYRLLYGVKSSAYQVGETRTFRTHPGETKSATVSFAVVTGMNYAHFHDPTYRRYRHRESAQRGFPAFVSMLKANPTYFVGTGDNVYYDVMAKNTARTETALRQKHHEQFVQPRLVEFFGHVPTYWMKDDHDYRFNDSDPHTAAEETNAKDPSHALGVRMFLEQLPVADPAEKNPKTYRTHRVSDLLQIWFVENRDYRSPNKMPDGPEKSIWGIEQREWLKRTLRESNAAFKVLFTPTPMVGPDQRGKTDNHVNPRGFRHEADTFFEWLKQERFDPSRFVIVCGDRHWQYHARHPSGFDEFSAGVVDVAHSNTRGGWKVGDPNSSDPQGLIKQLYIQEELTGGFLLFTLRPAATGAGKGDAEFVFYNDFGGELYRHSKRFGR